jgi:hypothetical protein
MGKGCLVSILIELLIPISFAALIKLILWLSKDRMLFYCLITANNI